MLSMATSSSMCESRSLIRLMWDISLSSICIIAVLLDAVIRAYEAIVWTPIIALVYTVQWCTVTAQVLCHHCSVLLQSATLQDTPVSAPSWHSTAASINTAVPAAAGNDHSDDDDDSDAVMMIVNMCSDDHTSVESWVIFNTWYLTTNTKQWRPMKLCFYWSLSTGVMLSILWLLHTLQLRVSEPSPETM